MLTPSAPAPTAAPAAPALKAVPNVSTADAAPATVPGTTPAAAAKVAEEIRRMKLKIDGFGDEVELPEAEILKLAGHNAKSLIEARKHAADLETLRNRLKDPNGLDDLLAEHGYDLDARAIERLNKKVQAQLDDESLTPEVRELRTLRAEKEAREKADRERGETEKKTAREQQVAQQKDHFANVIMEALKQTSLPAGTKDEQLFTSQLLAQELKRSVDNKLFVNPAILAKQTEEMFRTSVKPVLAKMQGEHLADFLGPDALKALVRVFAQRQGLGTAKAGEPAKKVQTAAEKRQAEKAATQDFFGGTRRAWRR